MSMDGASQHLSPSLSNLPSSPHTLQAHKFASAIGPSYYAFSRRTLALRLPNRPLVKAVKVAPHLVYQDQRLLPCKRNLMTRIDSGILSAHCLAKAGCWPRRLALQTSGVGEGRLWDVLDGSRRSKRHEKNRYRAHNDWKDDPLEKEVFTSLELEIFRFMESSDNLDSFPTKFELVRAGRTDLVDAILTKGGWLTAGWDMESDTGEDADNSPIQGSKTSSIYDAQRKDNCIHDLKYTGSFNHSPRDKNMLVPALGVQARRQDSGSDASRNLQVSSQASSKSVGGPRPLASDDGIFKSNSGLHPQKDSGSRVGDQNMNALVAGYTEGEDGCKPEVNHASKLPYPIAGSLPEEENLLSSMSVTGSQSRASLKEIDTVEERKRGWEKFAKLFGLTSSQGKPEHDRRTILPDRHSQRSGGAHSSSLSKGGAHVTPDASFPYIRRSTTDRNALKNIFLHPQPTGGSQSLEDAQQMKRRKKKKKKRKSLEAGSVDCNTNTVIDRINEKVDRRVNWMLEVKSSSQKPPSCMQHKGGPVPISSRICSLESSLAATLAILRSGRHALGLNDSMKQVHDRALEDLEKASDALEFRETEVMRTRAELRTTRAQVTVLEGKMALEIIEAHKVIEEKDKKLESASKVLKMMRSARIVWPNPASEVLLAGSFDGWTSQIKMQKSGAGVFVTSLQLLPGRYEIKFIVDGIWRVDPNRPIMYADGMENNVLTIV